MVDFKFCMDRHTKPVVDPEVRGKIPDCHIGETVGFREHNENADTDSKTDVTEEDELGVLGLVKRTAWVEVVDTSEEPVDLALSATLKLTLVVIVTGDIAKEIHWPAQELLSDGVDQGCNRGLFSQLVQFVDHFPDTTGINLASLGNEDHVTLHVSGGLVMFAVGDFP